MKAESPLHFCEVDSHKLAYLRSGAGAPVLLLHGITTYSFIWDEILRGLAYEYDVIAPDLLGCGASDMPLDQSYALKDHARRTAALIHTLDLGPCHVVGHDLGGGIAQILAVRYPDLVQDMVLMNTVGYDYWPVQPITALRAPIIRQLLMATLDLGMFRQVIRRGLHDPDLLDEPLLERFRAPLATPTGRKAFLHFARCLDSANLMDLEEDLRRLSIPVLVIRGEGDRYLGPAIAERLERDIPDCTLVRIPTAGHFIQIDKPDLVTASLRKFWSDIAVTT